MTINDVKNISTHCTRTEFVGTTVLDTIGLVISGIDDTLLAQMNVGTRYHALGLFFSFYVFLYTIYTFPQNFLHLMKVY